MARRCGREVEGTPLLREHTGKTRIEGSNPSISANNTFFDVQKSPNKPHNAMKLCGFLFFNVQRSLFAPTNFRGAFRVAKNILKLHIPILRFLCCKFRNFSKLSWQSRVNFLFHRSTLTSPLVMQETDTKSIARLF